MPEETWEEIKAQVQAQVDAIYLMDTIGKKAYHKINKTRFRSLKKVNYVPLDGVNIESIWSSSDAQIECEKIQQEEK